MGYDIEKEKREAIEAGRRALNSLQAAKENLNSAKNWGLVDMFGGGFLWKYVPQIPDLCKKLCRKQTNPKDRLRSQCGRL